MPTYGEIFKFAFEKTKKNFLFLLGLVLIIYGVSVIGGFIQGIFTPDQAVLATLIGLVFSLINVLLELGALKIFLKVEKGERPDYNELYRHYPLFLNFFIAGILMGLSIVLGFILLILPGIYIAVKLQFVPVIVANKGVGPVQALKDSWNLTNGRWWKIFGFDLLIIGINILGVIALLVGLLFTIPLTTLAYVHLYRKIS